MPESPPKRPPRPPQGQGGTPQQLRPIPQAEYHNIPINDSNEEPRKLQGSILLQPEMSPMLSEMQSPYQPTSVALETKDMFAQKWLHRRALSFSYFQLLCAVVLLILGVVSAIIKPSYYHVGVGFWLAVFTIACAGVGILAARYKTQELVGVFLVLSIVTVFLSFCGLVVVSVGLDADLNSYETTEVAANGPTPATTPAAAMNQSSLTNMTSLTASPGNASLTTDNGIKNKGTTEIHFTPAPKITTGVFLVIAVSTEMIMAFLSWLTCWQALCGSRTKGDCITEATDFCADTFCFCCTR